MEILEFENIEGFEFPSVITIGMFDGVHKGHKLMLEELKSLAKKENCKSVAITFANHPRLVLDKNNEQNPIELLQTPQERFAKIASSNVDYLVTINFTKEFASLSPKQFLDVLIPKINPKHLLLGYDNSFGNPKSNEFQEICSQGFYKQIKIHQDKSGLYEGEIEISSTEVRKALKEGRVPIANTMLEEEYSIYSSVEKGFSIGRTLGFPTANITIPKHKLIPKDGVYATRVKIEDKLYNSVTNIGYRPTFQGKNKTIETFILDFSQDIYTKELKLYFVDYLREEKAFENAEDLKHQIEKDVENAKKILS